MGMSEREGEGRLGEGRHKGGLLAGGKQSKHYKSHHLNIWALKAVMRNQKQNQQKRFVLSHLYFLIWCPSRSTRGTLETPDRGVHMWPRYGQSQMEIKVITLALLALWSN